MLITFELKDTEKVKGPSAIFESVGTNRLLISIDNKKVTIDAQELQLVLNTMNLKKQMIKDRIDTTYNKQRGIIDTDNTKED